MNFIHVHVATVLRECRPRLVPSKERHLSRGNPAGMPIVQWQHTVTAFAKHVPMDDRLPFYRMCGLMESFE